MKKPINGKLSGLSAEIIDFYQSGLNTTKLARKYGVAPAAIRRVLKTNNISLRGQDTKLGRYRPEIIDRYKMGMSLSEIAEEYSVSLTTVHTLIKRAGIMRSLSESNRVYSINETVFDKINSEDKAYWLGYLYADGNHFRVKYRVSLEIQRRDLSMLEKFKAFLGFSGPIKETFGKSKGSHCNRLTIQNKRISDNLMQWGMRPGKTFDIDFPDWLPEPLLAHFIRGFFDGDGTMGVYTVKGGHSTSRQVNASFVGHIQMMQGLSQYLNNRLGLNFILRIEDPKGHPEIFKACINGRRNVISFCDYIYKDATLFLARKKEKYSHMLEMDSAYQENPRGKERLSVSQVVEVKRLLESGRTRKAIAENLGVTIDAVGKIKTGQAWSWLTGYEYKPKSKLDIKQIGEILTLLKDGNSQTGIAKIYGVSRNTIGNLKRGIYRSRITGIKPLGR